MNIFKDNNDWNEKSIIGFIAFTIMCVIMIIDLKNMRLHKDWTLIILILIGGFQIYYEDKESSRNLLT